MDLDHVCDELYSLPPAQFTETRNERARQAREAGDRDLAQRIRGLGRPTTSAWLVNQVARELGDELEPLLDLGRELRAATSEVSADELRALTRQRRQVVQALVQRARELGARRGAKVSESVAAEVRQTLDASLADPAVADAVRAGRLTHPVEYAGFGEPHGASWGGPGRRTPTRAGARTPSSGRAASTTVTDLAARRREHAERALADAEAALEAARHGREEAAEESRSATAELHEAEAAVERLRADLDAARKRAHVALRAEQATGEQLRRADQAVDRAERARREAADRLAGLDD